MFIQWSCFLPFKKQFYEAWSYGSCHGLFYYKMNSWTFVCMMFLNSADWSLVNRCCIAITLSAFILSHLCLVSSLVPCSGKPSILCSISCFHGLPLPLLMFMLCMPGVKDDEEAGLMTDDGGMEHGWCTWYRCFR